MFEFSATSLLVIIVFLMLRKPLAGSLKKSGKLAEVEIASALTESKGNLITVSKKVQSKLNMSREQIDAEIEALLED